MSFYLETSGRIISSSAPAGHLSPPPEGEGKGIPLRTPPRGKAILLCSFSLPPARIFIWPIWGNRPMPRNGDCELCAYKFVKNIDQFSIGVVMTDAIIR